MILHEYQKRLANFIAQHPRAIISVDMGLGKTAAVLAWMEANGYESAAPMFNICHVSPHETQNPD
jgi:SNF2 family DNA or RNA helicase